MGREQIRVHTFLREVECTVDKKTTGRELLLEVTEVIDVKPAFFFSLQYDCKDGRRKTLKLNRPVLDHKIDNRHKPLLLYFRLVTHPPKGVEFNDRNTKLVIYRELKQSFETGEFKCCVDVSTKLTQLCQEERVEEFLKEVSEKVENYGELQFNMKRDDGYPVLVTTSVYGVIITAGREKQVIPFAKMKNVKLGNKSITLKQLAPAPDVKLTGPDYRFAKEVQGKIMVNYAVAKQLQMY